MKKIILSFFLTVGILAFSKAQALVPLSPLLPHLIFPIETPEQRCTRITARLNERISVFETRKNKHETSYDNLKSRLNTLVSKLDARGYDTNDLKSEILTLGNKMDKFKGDYDAFLSKLSEIKGYVCSHTDAEAIVKVGEARTLLKTVRGDESDIRNYYMTVIRPDIVQISKQKPSN